MVMSWVCWIASSHTVLMLPLSCVAQVITICCIFGLSAFDRVGLNAMSRPCSVASTRVMTLGFVSSAVMMKIKACCRVIGLSGSTACSDTDSPFIDPGTPYSYAPRALRASQGFLPGRSQDDDCPSATNTLWCRNPVTLCDLGILVDQAAEPAPAQNAHIGHFGKRMWP